MRRRTILAIAIGLVATGVAAAWQEKPAEKQKQEHGEKHGHGETVKALAVRNIAEKIDGKDATATTVEVVLEPGQASAAHRHPGPAFGYVLEGTYEWGIDDQPSKILKAGETFYEPGGCLHRVSKNPGKVRTRVLAWVLHPREAKEIVIPIKK